MTTTFADHLAAALDPVAFAVAVGFTPDRWQAELLRDTEHDWIALCSRQSGKSTCAAAAALWRCLYRAGSLSLICSAGARQAQEVLGLAVQMYGRIGRPLVSTSENMSQLILENKARLLSLPSQSPATVRGYTPDFLVVDEAAQCSDELFYGALRPMQLVSGATMWLLSSPFGKRGFFHREYTEGGERWKRAKITAEMCERVDADFLEAERRTNLWFAAEYLCEFTETSAERVFSDAEIEALFPTDPEVEQWNVV